MLPLEGIKILDLTRVLSGPFCTMILSDFGADVIKIEIPRQGDDSRAFGPYQNGESAYFMSINRNKKSVAIDTRMKEGVELIKKLIPKVDVLVENFKPGTMEKIGLGYEDVLKEINPQLIYCAISGYGKTGPWSKRPAYDAIVQAAGGIMGITGMKAGEYTRVGASIGDITAGLYAAISIPLALIYREKMNKGQMIDISMLDCQVAILENAIARYFVKNEIPKPEGNRHQSITPFESFVCKDGHQVMIAAGNNNLWEKFLKVANKECLKGDPRFKENYLRTENYKDLKPWMDKIFLEHDSQWWYDHLVEAGVPITFINTIDRVVENEQIVAREMIKRIYKDTVGEFKLADTPIKSSEMNGGIHCAAPLLGEHTEEVLMNELNLKKEEIEKLKERGVIG